MEMNESYYSASKIYFLTNGIWILAIIQIIRDINNKFLLAIFSIKTKSGLA